MQKEKVLLRKMRGYKPLSYLQARNQGHVYVILLSFFLFLSFWKDNLELEKRIISIYFYLDL